MNDTKPYLPYNPALKEKARALRRNLTEPERRLWHQCLRGFPYPVLRQKPIADFIVDFYCSRLQLVIEVDGDSHYTEEASARDTQRDEALRALGLTVLRFTNLDVMQNLPAVCERIHAAIPPTPPLSRGEPHSTET